MVDSGTDFDVSVATHLQALRVTVRDYRPSPTPSEQKQSDRNPRGVALIADLSRAWGVQPAADGGKMAWAVFDAHPDRAAPQDAR